METVCKLRYKEGHARRARVRNLVVPLRYEDDTTAVTEDFTRQVRQALDNLRDKQNVTVRFIGYTDDVPLTGRNERIYGNHLALSKARAHRVALAMQEALGLPSTRRRERRSRCNAAGRLQRHRAGARAEPPRRGGVLVRRPAAGAAGRAAAVPGRRAATRWSTKVYDPPWGTHRAARSSRTASR